MPVTKKTIINLLLILSVPVLASSCQAMLAAGATKTGVSLAQDRSTGMAIDDSIIWTKIKESFLQKDIDNLLGKVDVEVNAGRVLLTGVVQEPETRINASVLAWQPEGVKEVINEVQIANTQNIKDFARDVAIATQVRGKLLLEKKVKSVNYTVDCVNGIVYLIGPAQSDEELKRATFIASKVKGVQKVVSHMKIKEARTTPAGSNF